MKDRLHMGKRGAVLTFIAALMIGAVALTTVACGGGGSGGGGLSGKITESGSTTVQPVAEKLATAFTKDNPNAKVVIQGGGSSAGIKACNDGTVDIGAASRELTASDPTLVTHLLARDGIAVITNPDNSISGLTKQQVRDIFSGNITNWNQVGGADKKIIVISREEGSGTRTAFEDMVMNKQLITSDAILQTSTGTIKTAISGTPYSIGYLSLGYTDANIKTLAIDGIACTEENAKSGAYPIVRPLYFLTKAQPDGVVKEFIDFCLGAEGQAIVVSEGYLPAE